MKGQTTHRFFLLVAAMFSLCSSLTQTATAQGFSTMPRNQENIREAERQFMQAMPELRKQYEAQYGPLIEQYQATRPEQEAPAASVASTSPTQANSTQALTMLDVFWWLVSAGFGLLLLGAGSIVLNRKIREWRRSRRPTLIPVLSLSQIFSKMACPCCQNPIEFPSAYQGNRIPCPHCERGIVLQSAVISGPDSVQVQPQSNFREQFTHG